MQLGLGLEQCGYRLILKFWSCSSNECPPRRSHIPLEKQLASMDVHNLQGYNQVFFHSLPQLINPPSHEQHATVIKKYDMVIIMN